jgi:2-hydroxymuconate-semialdehyde hydrolase
MRLAALALALSGCLSFHAAAMPDAPKDATFETVAGVPLHYVQKGVEKPAPVVFLHGFASSLHVWDAVIPVVAAEHRVVALDLKGFGLSGRPEGDYSPLAEAELVWGLLDKLGVKDASIVAHSWGSSVALAMAMQRPDRVRRLALYDAWVYSGQMPLFFWSAQGGSGEALFALFYDERPEDKLVSAFHDPENVTEALVENVERQLARPGTKAAALAAVRGHALFEKMEKRYGTIDKPTLLLWGREDRVATLGYGEKLSKELPKAKLVVYPQCGHFPMIEAKAASTEELRAFLAVDLPKAEPPKPEPPKEQAP